MINHHARETGVAKKARTLSVLSHLTTMLFAQLTQAISLNDLYDWLQLKAAAIGRFGVDEIAATPDAEAVILPDGRVVLSGIRPPEA